MNDKVLVFLSVPSVAQEYEVQIPVIITVKEAIQSLMKAVAELTNYAYIPSENTVLCVREYNAVLPYDSLIAHASIKNGDHLILI